MPSKQALLTFASGRPSIAPVIIGFCCFAVSKNKISKSLPVRHLVVIIRMYFNE